MKLLSKKGNTVDLTEPVLMVLILFILLGGFIFDKFLEPIILIDNYDGFVLSLIQVQGTISAIGIL